MGCGSSLPKNTGPVGISPQLKKLLVGGGEDAEGSPPSSIDLASEEYRNAKAVDGQLWGELVRAGYVHLYYNHDTCNKINVFPIPDGVSISNSFHSFEYMNTHTHTHTHTHIYVLALTN